MLDTLPPRERQIVDLLYEKGGATVVEIAEELPVSLSGQAIRAMLSRLQRKGFVRRQQSEKGFVYAPSVPEANAKQSALRQLIRVFFNNSPVGAASALLGMSGDLDDRELAELEAMIGKARKERQQ